MERFVKNSQQTGSAEGRKKSMGLRCGWCTRNIIAVPQSVSKKSFNIIAVTFPSFRHSSIDVLAYFIQRFALVPLTRSKLSSVSG